jgi:methylenetetrahydrofolate reductase (NADPH)
VPSSDSEFGWGGPGGIVFQKAYLEFFVSPRLFELLLPAFKRHPSLTYHAITKSGAATPSPVDALWHGSA